MPDIDVQVHDGTGFVQFPYVEQLTIHRTEAKHDLISLTTRSAAVGTDLSGRPVRVSVNLGAAVVNTYGYLEVAAPARTEGAVHSSVHILGATNPMRNSTARAWSVRTPFSIAQDVIDPYRMALEMDPYPTPIDFFSQTDGESDWQLLVRLAKKIGFALVSEGIVVRMIDVALEERRTMTSNYEQLVIPSSSSTNKNVTAFSLMASASPDDAEYKDLTLRGVDNLGVPFYYRPSFANPQGDIPPAFGALHGGTFDNLAEAEIEAARINRQARWTNMAKVMCLGYRDLRPGRCALVIDHDGQYGGFWFVTDVVHTISSSSKNTGTEATLCRDSLSPRTRQYMVRQPVPKYPAARLLNGAWQADRQWEKQLV